MSGRFEQIGKLRDVSGHLRLVAVSQRNARCDSVTTTLPAISILHAQRADEPVSNCHRTAALPASP
jgi:hypothetical protein